MASHERHTERGSVISDCLVGDVVFVRYVQEVFVASHLHCLDPHIHTYISSLALVGYSPFSRSVLL